MTGNELGRLLRDAVPEPPTRLSPDDVVRGARRRGLLKATAVLGTTAAAVAAGAFVLSRTGTATNTLVAVTPPPSSAARVAPCARDALSPSATGGGVISNGFTGATITLTNIGKSTCHLPERITSLRSVKADADLPIEPVASDHGGPQDLAPGAAVAFTIASVRVSGGSGNCLRPAPTALATPPVLGFTLPGTQEIGVYLEGRSFDLGCWPIVVSRLFAAQPPSTASPPPDTTGPFRPTDVSFVSPTRGWAISPGRLMQTSDGGATWSKLTAPPEFADHVRFANERIGYAWSVQRDLYISRDGGASWQPGKLTQVLQVEAAVGFVWAIAGNVPDPDVWRGPVGGSSFRKVGATPNRSGTLDVHGSYAYVVGVEGAGPIRGSVDVWNGLRRTNSALPCQGQDLYIPDSPLGISTDGTVFLVCDVEHLVQDQTPPPQQWAYTSTDHGRTWVRMPGPSQVPTDVTATTHGLFAWGESLERYDGTRWTVAVKGSGFATVGFQDDQHGVALSRSGQLYVTRDAGSSWTIAHF